MKQIIGEMMGIPNAEMAGPLDSHEISRNPWGSVKTETMMKDKVKWVDEMVKAGLIDKKSGEAMKQDLMANPEMQPMDRASEDPRMLKRIFGK